MLNDFISFTFVLKPNFNNSTNLQDFQEAIKGIQSLY
ncbi:hypothetical protein HEBU111660_02165 [Helicobacter burdigaliensis]